MIDWDIKFWVLLHTDNLPLFVKSLAFGFLKSESKTLKQIQASTYTPFFKKNTS